MRLGPSKDKDSKDHINYRDSMVYYGIVYYSLVWSSEVQFNINIRILQSRISGILLVLGLGIRMGDPFASLFGASRGGADFSGSRGVLLFFSVR